MHQMAPKIVRYMVALDGPLLAALLLTVVELDAEPPDFILNAFSALPKFSPESIEPRCFECPRFLDLGLPCFGFALVNCPFSNSARKFASRSASLSRCSFISSSRARRF